MKRIALILVLTWLAAGTCMAAGEALWPEESAGTTEPPGPAVLRLGLASASVGSFSIEIQSRTAIRMLLLPKSTLMGQIDIAGTCSLEPASEGRTIQAFDVQTASMAYYSPGAPNREIPRETIIQTLLVSGLPAPGHPVRVTMDDVGKVLEVEGVPEKYLRYYKTSLLEFSGRPVGVGESWANRSTIPVCIDPESETILCDALATFTLTAVDRAADRATIAFTSSYDNAPGQATGTGKIRGSSEGTVVVKLSDGTPVESRAVSASRLDFGGGNAVDMEQRIRTRMATGR